MNNNYYFISDVNYDNGIFLLKDKQQEDVYYKLGAMNKDIYF